MFYRPRRLLLKMVIMPIWISFALAGLVSAAAMFTKELQDDDWTRALFEGYHCYYISPIFTCVALLAFFPQAYVTLRLRSPQALSPHTLLLQAMVFACVAMSWVWRYPIPDFFGKPRELSDYIMWYLEVGWAAVDNAIFALTQAVLFVICLRVEHQEHKGYMITDEATPLLR